MGIIVAGSVAYDTIMRFDGRFSDLIVQEELESIHITFPVHGVSKQRGGNAGNICYTLALLGAKPLLFCIAGGDFDGYRSEIEAVGVNTAGVITHPEQLSPTSYIITDRAYNQIAALYPGPVAHSAELSLQNLPLDTADLIVVSPTHRQMMARFVQEAQELKMGYIYAPGQQMVHLDQSDLIRGVERARLLITNEYEYEVFRQRTGFSPADVTAKGALLIVTRGDQGSAIYSKNKVIEIPVVRPIATLDPTGAGDAYCAGVAYCLQRGFGLTIAGRVAALAATYAVESYGTQTHYFSREEFERRYFDNFSTSISL